MSDLEARRAAWSRFCAGLEDAGDILLREEVPRSDLDAAEGCRYLAQQLCYAISATLGNQDPERPHLELLGDRLRKWAMLCSDAKAHEAPLRGDLRYRLRGTRGTVHHLGFQVLEGEAGVAYLDETELQIDDAGRFDILLAAEEEPGPWRGWLRLSPDATRLLVRQYFYDWEGEEPARVEIECLDISEAPEPLSGADVDRGLEEIVQRFKSRSGALLDQVTTHKAPNALSPPRDAQDEGGAAKVAYGLGYFRLQPDEALVVSVRPPPATYWSVQLGNFWHEELDYEYRVSSLNGHQALLDADGLFRVVVALRDPGVPNWLDTAGHHEGRIIFRWQGAASSPETLQRVVPIAELREHLPPDTPRVDAAARRASIAKRRRHVARRFT
jgi:hypothetical protein